MKIFNLLKNKTGKLVIGAPQLVAIAGVGLMATYGAFKTDQMLDEAAPIRTLSSVSAASSYEGLNRRADGMLSSMNIQNREGRKGVAVGADRERLEGSRSKSDFGLSAVDNLGRTVSVPGAGTAAATSATDGLGSGGVDMVEIGGGNAGVRASVPEVSSSSVAQGTAGAPAGTAGGGRLASASMARASGNAFNAASGSIGGGRSAGASNGLGGSSSSASSGTEGYQFSGSMPSGTNIVSSYDSLNAGVRGATSFGASGRDSSVGRRRGTAKETNELKLMSKMSADVAKDRNRSAVGGAAPFLASSAVSGGMSIDGGAETATTGSADFATPTDRNLKAIGDWGQQVESEEDERAQARQRLLWMTLALLAAALVAMPFMYKLMFTGALEVKTGDLAKKATGAAKIAWGWVIAGVVMAYAAVVMGFARDYLFRYSGNKWMPSLSLLMGAGAITMTLISAKQALANAKSAKTTELAKDQAFYQKSMGWLKTGATTAGTTVGASVVQKGMSKD